MKSVVQFLTLSCLISSLYACAVVEVGSTVLGNIFFNPISTAKAEEAGIVSGRTAYKTNFAEGERALYLYHTLSEPAVDGNGRWVINDVLGASDSAIAYVDTWAVLPHFVYDINDAKKTKWRITVDGNWTDDDSLHVFCHSKDESVPHNDGVIFFESSPLALNVGGYYLEAVLDETSNVNYTGPLYTQVKPLAADSQMYLYKLDEKWIIGDTIGVEAGVAFVEDSAEYAGEIKTPVWNFVVNGIWETDTAVILSASSTQNVVTALREFRNIKFIPNGQKVGYLRNGMVIPLIGLGTGALNPDTQEVTIDKALRMGYRALDLAREYQNEEVVAKVLKSYSQNQVENAPYRSDMFLISKVWPTHLGYLPTTQEIFRSLEALQSPYIDLYYIHWPACNSEVEWFHCESTVDQDGTWTESWRALERAYAEGRLNAIGVSNFGVDLLDKFTDSSSIAPHAVQNFAQIGELDDSVRDWCSKHSAIYQPYASQRDMSHIRHDLSVSLNDVATNHNVSTHAASLRFFLQTGAAVIPRSENPAHLLENLNVFSWELTSAELKSLGWIVNDPETTEL